MQIFSSEQRSRPATAGEEDIWGVPDCGLSVEPLIPLGSGW